MTLPTGIRSVTSKSMDVLDITTKSHQIFQKGTSPKVGKNRGFAQTFPYVAVFFDEPFDGFGAHLLVGVLREPVHHLLQIFGMLLQVLVDLVLLLSREARGTSRPRVGVQADQSGSVPAFQPCRHGISRDLIDVGNAAQRTAL